MKIFYQLLVGPIAQFIFIPFMTTGTGVKLMVYSIPFLTILLYNSHLKLE